MEGTRVGDREGGRPVALAVGERVGFNVGSGGGRYEGLCVGWVVLDDVGNREGIGVGGVFGTSDATVGHKDSAWEGVMIG